MKRRSRDESLSKFQAVRRYLVVVRAAAALFSNVSFMLVLPHSVAS